MNELIKTFGDKVVGVTHGFDRIVFKGTIRALAYPEGAEGFFRRRRILFKDARAWVIEHTQRLLSAVEEWSRRECGEPITWLPTFRERKDDMARQRQQEKGITGGLIGTWKCLESGRSYRLARGERGPRLIAKPITCSHVYTYLYHPEYGFMSIRLQTWFPYEIQIAMNGREWLARQLEKAAIGFEKIGNKILQVDDFSVMQPLLDQQLTTNWCSLLDSFVAIAFPTFRATLGPDLSYYWTLWQSEWASDILFSDRGVLDDFMEAAVRHAFIGGHPERLLRYFGKAVRNDGQPWKNSNVALKTRIRKFDEGYCIRHWYGSNSVKMYNQLNILRLETTTNDPTAFRGLRRKQGEGDDAVPKLRPLRKSVADTTLRARVSQGINERFADHLATTRSTTPFGEILADFTRRLRRRGRTVRALDPTGKDLDLLRAIADPRFAVRGLANKDLRRLLADTDRYAGKTRQQRSGMTTRSLRLLRDHGVIRKLPKAYRYQLTAKGRRLVTVLQAALAASTEELTKLAA